MLKIVALYFCWTIILVSGNGDNLSQLVQHPLVNHTSVNVNAPPEPTVTPKTTPVTPETTPVTPETTSVTPKTTPVTPETTPVTPETTPVTPETTPVTPKTTPVTPKTTPVTPTTTPVTPKTTTVTPTTTPSHVTTPSPVTTSPVPVPKDGKWVVNGTNETCIVISMAVQFNVIYTAKNKTQHKVLTLPTDEASSVVTGNCGATEQTVNITWHGGNDSLNIHFLKNETTKRYSMHHVELQLGSYEFPDADSNETLMFVHEADQFSTGLTNSYRCMRLQKLELTRNDTNGTLGTIEISDLQFQAFKTDKTNGFSDAQDCSADVPDVVPIAVGCALTALVIIILGAYLVGRRRSQARGYVSM